MCCGKVWYNHIKRIYKFIYLGMKAFLIYSLYLFNSVSTGTGKTALMAKLAHEVSEEMGKRGLHRRPVIIRFCGTSIGAITVYFQTMLVCRESFIIYALLSRKCHWIGARAKHMSSDTLRART